MVNETSDDYSFHAARRFSPGIRYLRSVTVGAEIEAAYSRAETERARSLKFKTVDPEQSPRPVQLEG